MDYDDWLFDSIKRYRNLSMYDLQHGITAVDILDGKSLCVATSTGKKHEMCELSLPDKLLKHSQTGKIKKDRDFRVEAGGFSPHCVTEIKHLPGSRYCAIAQRGGSTSVWEMGNEETDLMREYKPITEDLGTDYPIRMSVSKDVNVKRLAIGSCTNTIKVIDTETFQGGGCLCGGDTVSQVTALEYESNHQLWCCTVSGDISLLDTQSKNSKVLEHGNCERPSSFWTMSNVPSQSDCVLQMSSEGDVILLDKRNLSSKVTVSNIGLSTGQNFEHLCVQLSPDGSRFSVSGFDGCVHLYNTKASQSQEKNLEPVFVHEGHVINLNSQSDCVTVSKHLRHPWLDGLLISCGDDGSIHAWEWNEAFNPIPK